MSSTPYDLTPAEVAVLRSIAAQETRKGVGRALGRSPNTVSDQLRRIYQKMGVKGSVQAVLLAERAGLLEGVTL